MISRGECKRVPLLVGLPEEELGHIASILVPSKVMRGEFVVHASERSSDLVFLLSGRARVTVLNDDGRELSLALLKSGDVFGEIALLTGSPRTADVVALSDCELFSLPRKDFFALLRRCPGFSLTIMQMLAHRVHDTSRKLADFVFLDLQARVLKTLQQLATLNKELQPPRMVVDDFLSRKDLAALVGASREAVSRALHGLQDSGHLEVSSSRVILFDLQS